MTFCLGIGNSSLASHQETGVWLPFPPRPAVEIRARNGSSVRGVPGLVIPACQFVGLVERARTRTWNGAMGSRGLALKLSDSPLSSSVQVPERSDEGESSVSTPWGLRLTSTTASEPERPRRQAKTPPEAWSVA